MLMNKEVSCGNLRGLIAYLRKHYGDDGIRKIFEGLVNNDRYLVSDKDDRINSINRGSRIAGQLYGFPLSRE